MTKTEIKMQLKEELKCPQSFIDRINKSGMIDELKKVMQADDRDIQKEAMDNIYQAYKDYNRQLKGLE